jgi:lipopolysaccharide/colanic/teichoic acid biosynthesis glycosyltransferase
LVLVKRAVDVVAGLVLAAVALPVICAIGVFTVVTLRAWPFFVQQRVGRGGRLFPFVKVRTLPKVAPRAADKYALEGLRIPRFCRILRRTHLDELPQLFLVPIGWMSLVGPRPEMPSVLAHYPAEFAADRTTIRPGCTGLWQLSPASANLIFEAPEYDRAYLNRGNLRLDVWLLYRTLRVWLPRARAVALADVPAWAWRRRHEDSTGVVRLPRVVQDETPSAIAAEVAD